MAAIERTAYPRFSSALTASELQTLYAPTDEERAFVAAHTRGPAQSLTLLVLLKCHQHLGYLPALADVAASSPAVSAARAGGVGTRSAGWLGLEALVARA